MSADRADLGLWLGQVGGSLLSASEFAAVVVAYAGKRLSGNLLWAFLQLHRAPKVAVRIKILFLNGILDFKFSGQSFR